MCRFTLYVGPTISLGEFLTEPENSLINQSFRAREREEPLNADGFGVAWYAPGFEDAPALYRSTKPAWSDANIRHIARVVRSSCILAHVRAATQVRAVSELNCHPFVRGPFAFMHNGDVGSFSRLRRRLLATLSDAAFDAVEGNTDSEHLFAVFLHEMEGRDPGVEEMAAALRRAFVRVLDLVESHGGGAPSYFNVAVSNGRGAVVSRFASDDHYGGESLYVNRGRRFVCEDGLCRMATPHEDGGAILVSSEALSEDPGWEPIPDDHLIVVAEDRTVRIEPVFETDAASLAGRRAASQG